MGYTDYRQEFERARAWGLLAAVDLKDCNPEKIRDADSIKAFVYGLCHLIDMKRFGECQVVHFGEDERVAGYSMYQLIETSNIGGHFANADNSAYIDIFSCKAYSPEQVQSFAQMYFDAKSSKLQVILRQ